MSRTYRRRSGDQTDLKYQTSNHVRVPGYYIWYWEPMDPKSKEYKKAVNKYHSDAGNWTYGGSPPGWFVAQYVQRPYRRDAQEQIRKWMLDPDYEIMIRTKDPLPYWD